MATPEQKAQMKSQLLLIARLGQVCERYERRLPATYQHDIDDLRVYHREGEVEATRLSGTFGYANLAAAQTDNPVTPVEVRSVNLTRALGHEVDLLDILDRLETAYAGRIAPPPPAQAPGTPEPRPQRPRAVLGLGSYALALAVGAVGAVPVAGWMISSEVADLTDKLARAERRITGLARRDLVDPNTVVDQNYSTRMTALETGRIPAARLPEGTVIDSDYTTRMAAAEARTLPPTVVTDAHYDAKMRQITGRLDTLEARPTDTVQRADFQRELEALRRELGTLARPAGAVGTDPRVDGLTERLQSLESAFRSRFGSR